MHLVGPFAHCDGCFSGRRSKDTRHGHAARPQMREKAVLLEQSFAIAHGAVMALDEDALLRSVIGARGDDAGSRKWAWADGEDARGLADPGKLTQKQA